MLWDARLGHVGEKDLNELLKQGMLKHRKKFTINSCDECILAKSKKLPYPTIAMIVNFPLDYVLLIFGDLLRLKQLVVKHYNCIS